MEGGAYDVEHKKAGCYGNDSAEVEGCYTVRDSTHGVLADAPMDVTACIVAVDATSCS